MINIFYTRIDVQYNYQNVKNLRLVLNCLFHKLIYNTSKLTDMFFLNTINKHINFIFLLNDKVGSLIFDFDNAFMDYKYT